MGMAQLPNRLKNRQAAFITRKLTAENVTLFPLCGELWLA